METGHGRLYGRRLGRPLRSVQRTLHRELLPRLAIPPLALGGRVDPNTLFDEPKRRVWLEIGFGGGEHLARQAADHPAIGFIGCEVFTNGIVRLLGEVDRRGLSNVRLFTDDARMLIDALPPRSVERVFILFPDPWPKQRHHKRRLISHQTLNRLAEIMSDGAELRLATDDPTYLDWMLERTTDHPEFEWLARRPADWRERPVDWPATRYEEKALAAGRAPIFLRFRRRARFAAAATVS